MSILVFSFVLHTIPSFARISIKTLLAPPPDDGDDDDDDGDGDVADDGDGDDGHGDDGDDGDGDDGDGGILVQAPMKIFTALVVGLGKAILSDETFSAAFLKFPSESNIP